MQLSKITSFISHVSIDVVGGAVLSTAFAASILDVAIPFWYFLAFAGVVWVTYTLDHLIDAYLIRPPANNVRHLFHQKYFKVLATFVVFVSFLVLFLVLNKAEQQLILAGITLAAMSLVHLFLVSFEQTKNSWFVQKELMVALVYTSGVWAGPAIIQGETPPWSVLALVVVFGITVWIEGALMAYMERDSDLAQKTPSIVTKLGLSQSKKIIRFSGILCSLVSLTFAAFLSGQLRSGWVILLLMNVLLLILQHSKRENQSSAYVHLLGELTFWLPGIIIFF